MVTSKYVQCFVQQWIQHHQLIPTIYSLSGMLSCHPSGILIEIQGINRDDRGKSREEPDICGHALHIDAVVWFRRTQVLDGKSHVLFFLLRGRS